MIRKMQQLFLMKNSLKKADPEVCFLFKHDRISN